MFICKHVKLLAPIGRISNVISVNGLIFKWVVLLLKKAFVNGSKAEITQSKSPFFPFLTAKSFFSLHPYILGVKKHSFLIFRDSRAGIARAKVGELLVLDAHGLGREKLYRKFRKR